MSMNICLANLKGKDAQFVRTLLETFTDPQNAAIADKVRDGTVALQYDPATGQVLLVDLRADGMATAHMAWNANWKN